MGNCQPEPTAPPGPTVRLTPEQIRNIQALQRPGRLIRMEGLISLGPDMEATHIVIIPDPNKPPGAKQQPICVTIDPDDNSAVECPNCQRYRRTRKATNYTLCMEHLVNFTVMMLILLAFIVVLVIVFKSNKVKVRWPRVKIVKAGAKGGADIFKDEFGSGKDDDKDGKTGRRAS